MKKLLLRSILFIPMLMLVIGINIYIDPANIYRGSYEKQIANILLENKNAIYEMPNYDERALQREYINHVKVVPRMVAIGSSQVMSISADMTEEKNFFNNGVSGATLYDLLGIVELYQKNDMLPSKMLIGITPQMFDAVYTEQTDRRWVTLQDEAEKMIAILEGRNYQSSFSVSPIYTELLSPSYFQASINAWQQGIDPMPKVTATTEFYTDKYVKCADGSITYPPKLRNASVAEVDTSITNYTSQNNLSHYTKNYVMDPQYMKTFEKLITYLLEQNIEISFFISPYPSRMFQYFQKNPEYSEIFKVEPYLRELSARFEIPLYGSFNPNVCGCADKDFFDWGHLKKESVFKALSFQMQ